MLSGKGPGVRKSNLRYYEYKFQDLANQPIVTDHSTNAATESQGQTLFAKYSEECAAVGRFRKLDKKVIIEKSHLRAR